MIRTRACYLNSCAGYCIYQLIIGHETHQIADRSSILSVTSMCLDLMALLLLLGDVFNGRNKFSLVVGEVQGLKLWVHLAYVSTGGALFSY